MSSFKKFLAVAAVLAMASAVLYVGKIGSQILGNGEVPENALISKPTVNIWYTDEALGDFLASAALEFSSDRDVRVIPRLVSGLEYLETINQESLHSSSIPDMYIIGNDSLEKAYLSGLASVAEDDGYVSSDSFPEAALRAVTYDEKIVAYPFYYETSALIYNKTYMEEHAKTVMEAEADAKAGEEAMAALEDGEAADGGTSDSGEDAAGDGASGEEAVDDGASGSEEAAGDGASGSEAVDAALICKL